MPTKFGVKGVNLIDMATGEIMKMDSITSLTIEPSDEELTELAEKFGYLYEIGAFGVTMDLNLDTVSRRILSGVADSRLANNNWRKMHHLPMWRK